MFARIGDKLQIIGTVNTVGNILLDFQLIHPLKNVLVRVINAI